MKIKEIHEGLGGFLKYAVGLGGEDDEESRLKHAKSMVKKVANDAYQEFLKVLKKSGYDTKNLAISATAPPPAPGKATDYEKISQYLKKWTDMYMTAGDPDIKGEIQRAKVIQKIQSVAIPVMITNRELADYFLKAATARIKGKEEAGTIPEPDAPPTPPTPPTPKSPEEETEDGQKEIIATLPRGSQHTFLWPTNPRRSENVHGIIRPEGYFLDKLPASLRGGLVKRDKATGLYPIANPDNIKEINDWYEGNLLVISTNRISSL